MRTSFLREVWDRRLSVGQKFQSKVSQLRTRSSSYVTLTSTASRGHGQNFRNYTSPPSKSQRRTGDVSFCGETMYQLSKLREALSASWEWVAGRPNKYLEALTRPMPEHLPQKASLALVYLLRTSILQILSSSTRVTHPSSRTTTSIRKTRSR